MTADLTRRGFLASLAASYPLLRSVEMWAAPARRPNIILIMADDMGFSDIGCYGSEIATPNLDGLAKKGIRFTQFYNTPRCCPSRATLLTGLYCHQAGIGHMVGDYGVPGYRGFLNDRCVTIAEAIRPAGYTTLMVGKWHVGEKRPHWPVDRGFEHYYGLVSGGSNYWKVDQGRVFAVDDQQTTPTDKDFYVTDAFSNQAVAYLDKHGRSDKPFFLYLAYTAPHWPLHAWPDDIAKYKGKYMKGWDKLREERHRRQLDMGLLDPKWPITPRDKAAPAWDDVADKEMWDLRMAVYAAQVDRMDQGIGRVVAKLRELGKLDDTLIMFLTDNGGCAEAIDRGQKGVPPGPVDSFLSYHLPWANASNTPFRLYKHWVHEGGISSPLVVHWPAVIKDGGKLTGQVGHTIDVMATCLDVAGGEYPKTLNGKEILPLEGKSLLPIFEGKEREPHKAIFWEHEGNRAVRQGKWKLVSRHPGGWELYDMEADRTELNNLAGRNPDKVKELSTLYDAWAKRCNVEPWPVRGTARPRTAVGDKRLSYDLKQGDELLDEKAPHVAGRAIRITATVEPKSPNGVILAQGGSALGYSLFLKDGVLAFATRHRGALTTVLAKEKLPAGKVEVAAELAKDGAVTLTVGGKTVATGKAPGPIPDQPVDGLQVGSDANGAVGEYEAPNAFQGTIHSARLELRE
jgi:arylsulfatase